MSVLEGMLLPAIAGGVAVCFSHPLELIKTRLQLDNERVARGTARQYAGPIDCLIQTWRSAGIAGLQRGLGLGVVREVFFNAVRIGLFDPILLGVHAGTNLLRSGQVEVQDGSLRASPAPSAQERTAAGLICGGLGGCVVNPVEVLKTRMQAQGGSTGYQHGYASVSSALAELVRKEGLAGCVQGMSTSILRGLLGPGSQLVAYNEMKAAAAARGVDTFAVSTHIGCALGSAAVSTLCVSPVDVVRTRLYNQPVGSQWYASGVDAALQLARTEGPFAFYKGALSHYLRLGPHMVLVFGFLEQLKSFRARAVSRKCGS